MKLAIVGSRVLARNPEAERLIEALLDEHKPLMVVSGGADGIDSMAAKAARARGIPVQEFLPEISSWEQGYKPRNMLIAQHCDFLACITAMSATACGSGWTRQYAEGIGKPTSLHVIDDRPKKRKRKPLFDAAPELTA